MFSMLKNNFKSILIALVILYLSTTESENLEPPGFLDFQHADKVIHFLMYFAFMLVLSFDNRVIIEKKKNIFFIGIIPFVFGLVMEACQELFTLTRGADIFDALSNTLGILFAALIWTYLSALFKKDSDRNPI